MVGSVRDSEGSPPYGPISTRPTPEDQIRFIANIERILAEGSFVATYKYALLIALVDLAIERGDDSNSELELPVDAIARRFIEIYWQQAAPYKSGDELDAFVLRHSTGKQAKAIRLLASVQKHFMTLESAKRSKQWIPLVAEMRALVSTMPLWKLQTVHRTSTEFLYTKGTKPGWITLLPGVASHLRERAPLIRRLAQTEWLQFVLSLKRNQPALGRATGLSEFLFGANRSALAVKIRKPLRDLQHGRCFYCQNDLAAAAAVDHFIPWSQYPRDLAHNLVLAHAGCNSQKSDLLGGEPYLERWANFVSNQDVALTQIGTDAGLLVDRATSLSVAQWSYEHAERVQAEVWLGGRKYGHLSNGWRALLPV
jgi:HNH endonuclease